MFRILHIGVITEIIEDLNFISNLIVNNNCLLNTYYITSTVLVLYVQHFI